jgi:cytochrome c-type biogenesis protein CcmH/NrfF
MNLRDMLRESYLHRVARTVVEVCKQIASKLAPTAAALLVAISAHVAAAQTPSPATIDPKLEERVKTLSAELRCLVCQNQTVADSDAPVARDMRDQVRAQLAAGKSEAQVKQYMTERFGDFVLYKPPLKATTIVLWAAPFFALVIALGMLIIRLRNASRDRAPIAPLDAAARERARRLLAEEK